MQTVDLQRKWGLSADEVEVLRHAYGGVFGARRSKIVRDHRSRLLRIEPLEDFQYRHNIVTNEGLNHALDATLSGGTQITAWKVALFKTNTTPLATHTYASPGYTEVSTSNVDEATRQAWTDAGPSGQGITNAASPAVYTGDDSFTAYGCALVGGGTDPTVIANTAGGGKLWSSALFASSKAMDVDVQLEITYAFTAADDGV